MESDKKNPPKIIKGKDPVIIISVPEDVYSGLYSEAQKRAVSIKVLVSTILGKHVQKTFNKNGKD